MSAVYPGHHRSDGAGQWRKWRRPVTSIVAPASSTTRRSTSASRTEPPGWTKAVTPASRHASTASGNGIERVRGAGGTDDRRRARDRSRLLDGLAGRVDPRCLAAAEADLPSVADEDDGVARHGPDDAPGKVEIARFLPRWGPAGSRLATSRGRRRPCRSRRRGSPRRRSAGRPTGRARRGRRGVAAAEFRVDDEAEVGLRRQHVERGGLERRRDDHLEEDRRESLGQGGIHRTGDGDDPAERRDRIAGEGRLPGGDEVRPFGDAARVRVLDDDAGGAAEGSGESVGRGGVEDVVVGELPPGDERVGPPERRVGKRPSRAADSGRPAGAGSRRSGASRSSRGRSSAMAGRDRSPRAGPARRAGRHRPRRCGPAVRRRSGRRRPPCGGTPRWRARPGGRPGPSRPPRGRRGSPGSGPATSRWRRWRGSWPRPGRATGRRCRSPR